MPSRSISHTRKSSSFLLGLAFPVAFQPPYSSALSAYPAGREADGPALLPNDGHVPLGRAFTGYYTVDGNPVPPLCCLCEHCLHHHWPEAIKRQLLIVCGQLWPHLVLVHYTESHVFRLLMCSEPCISKWVRPYHAHIMWEQGTFCTYLLRGLLYTF